MTIINSLLSKYESASSNKVKVGNISSEQDYLKSNLEDLHEYINNYLLDFSKYTNDGVSLSITPFYKLSSTVNSSIPKKFRMREATYRGLMRLDSEEPTTDRFLILYGIDPLVTVCVELRDGKLNSLILDVESKDFELNITQKVSSTVFNGIESELNKYRSLLIIDRDDHSDFYRGIENYLERIKDNSKSIMKEFQSIPYPTQKKIRELSIKYGRSLLY